MAGTTMQPLDRWLPASVNRKLLPLKLHFFLYLAAQSGVYGYLAVIGRQNGISASVIAVIFALTPLAAVLVKPLCGYIIDRTQNVTAVIVLLQLVVVAAHGAVFFSPIVEQPSLTGDLDCYQGNFVLMRPSDKARACITCHSTSDPLNCTLSCSQIPGMQSVSTSIESITGNILYMENSSSICTSLEAKGWANRSSNNVCGLQCPCEADFSNYVSSGEFWTYTVSVVIAWVVTATLFTVTDAAVCEVLQDDINAFGHQRLWGTISWGICSPLIGLMIDEASSLERTDYTPGFYAFTVFMALDIALIFCMPRLKTAEVSPNYFADLGKVFYSAEIAVFTFWTFVIGALMGVLWSYSTWFLEDMGAPKLLIGLTNCVMSLCIELPFFFFSKNILERMGYFLSYSLAFVGFAIKFTGYSYLKNPWYGLFFELAGGAIFPLAYAAMTVFAKMAAKPGTSASMLCILGATFEGLGVGAGNLLGGFSIDVIKGPLTFRYLGYASMACAVLCTTSYVFIKRRQPPDSMTTTEKCHLTAATKGTDEDGNVKGANPTFAEDNYAQI